MSHDLQLSDLMRCLTEDDGALPDGTVVGSTGADWRAVVDFIASQGWSMKWLDTTTVNPDDENDLIRAGNTLAVWPTPGVQINFFPDQDVLFDFDRREIRDQAAATALGGFIRALAQHLMRDIAISYEGSWESVFLRYCPETDDFQFTG